MFLDLKLVSGIMDVLFILCFLTYLCVTFILLSFSNITFFMAYSKGRSKITYVDFTVFQVLDRINIKY